MYETVQKLETGLAEKSQSNMGEATLFSTERKRVFVSLYCKTAGHRSNLLSPVLLKECSQDGLQLEISTDTSGLRPQTL
jgi:hypothetical protein